MEQDFELVTSLDSRGASHTSALQRINEHLRLGYLLFEKCEFRQARIEYLKAVSASKEANHPETGEGVQGAVELLVEALTGLLRAASEINDNPLIERVEKELDQIMQTHSTLQSPSVWYCKGHLAFQRDNVLGAQFYYHRTLKRIRELRQTDPNSHFELWIKTWFALARTLMRRGKFLQAQVILKYLLDCEEKGLPPSLRGLVFLLKANFKLRYRARLPGQQGDFQNDVNEAEKAYHKAHAAFMSARSWYYNLFIMLGYAQIARLRKQIEQANFYLNLLDNVLVDSDFALLREQVAAERSRLEQQTVDLTVDRNRGTIQTREGKEISIRKQYVLLDILSALSVEHLKAGAHDTEGLTKSALIEKVWHEKYRPSAHDGKLYYNINRLRKLLEPDLKNPKYLMNSKKGYRLGSGLKVQVIGLVQKEKEAHS